MASSKIKGITIEIDGNTSKLNDALKDTEKRLSNTQKELRSVNSALKFDPKNTELLAQKQKLLGDAIKDTTSKLKTLKEAEEQAKAKGLDNNSEEYRALQVEISRTTTSLKGLQAQQDGTNESLDDGSEKASRFGDVLKANLASDAIVGGIKLLGNAIKAVGKEMASVITESANYADEVNTLAKQYNLSTKEIQQYQKASQLIDVEFSTIAKSLSKLTKNMTSTSKETTKAFKTLGVSVKDSKGQLRDSNEVFNEVIEALSKIENETQQDSLALQIFGKSSAELGSLINGGAEQLAEFNKYLEENNLLLSQEELDALNGVQDGFDILEATVESIKQKIGVELAPVITPLLEDIQKYIIDHKDDLVNMVKDAVEWLQSDEGKEMFENIKQVVIDIGELLLDLPDIKKDIELLAKPLKVVLELVEGILKMAQQIRDIFNGDYDWLEAKNTQGNPYIRNGYHSSAGFGSLQSGGYNITLNASFVANGNLDESQALRFADLMTERINQNLGNQL